MRDDSYANQIVIEISNIDKILMKFLLFPDKNSFKDFFLKYAHLFSKINYKNFCLIQNISTRVEIWRRNSKEKKSYKNRKISRYREFSLLYIEDGNEIERDNRSSRMSFLARIQGNEEKLIEEVG